jgi:hypothetical protein
MRKRPVIARLEHHYGRIRGELQHIQARIVAAGVSGPALAEYLDLDTEVARYREMLEHLAACLRLEEPDWNPKHITPRPPRAKRSPFDRGKLMNMAYDILREAREPISSSEILDGLWKKDRLTRAQSRDDELRSALTTLLRRQERLGAVRSHEGRPLRWSIIKSPGQIRRPSAAA